MNIAIGTKPRVAFVVQRAGAEVNGGAESHCLQVATRMSRHWNTEVLTTCALDYMEWRNHYAEGAEQLNGVTIRRFAVDHPRDITAFNNFSLELHPRREVATLDEQERWMRAQGPMSKGLLGYLRSHASDYDAFIFFGYLYATTYFGLPLVADKAFLAPLAHDEWPIYFSMWDKVFSEPRRLIFNTPAERNFLHRRFAALKLSGPTVGVGIEAPAQIRPARFRQRYNLKDPFVLYLGRIDESKGCREMLDYYITARTSNQLPYSLVLAGKEVMPVPFHDDVVSLGFLDEAEKWDALAACEWIWIPSPYESLSMSLLEAWSVRRPAVVNGKCDVLLAHCEAANGGLWYDNAEEWLAALTITDAATRRRLGACGHDYVRQHYSWARVEEQYRALLS